MARLMLSGVTRAIDLLSPLPDLNNNIAIQGPGASSLTVERAAGVSFAYSPIVLVDFGQTASISGLTVANGNDGGIVNNGTLTLTGCTISGNSASGGGGILNEGTMTIRSCVVRGNSAQGDGGGIANFAFLVNPMNSPGITLPKDSEAVMYPPVSSPQDALEMLRRAVERTKTQRMSARHPAFGALTHEQWVQLHLRHAELHLSFVVPNDVPMKQAGSTQS